MAIKCKFAAKQEAFRGRIRHAGVSTLSDDGNFGNFNYSLIFTLSQKYSCCVGKFS